MTIDPMLPPLQGPVVPLPCRTRELLMMALRDAPAALVPPGPQPFPGLVDPWPALASEAALECRLEAGPAPVDFAVCLRDARRSALAGALELPETEALSATSPDWNRIVRFLREWTQAGTGLSSGVRAVWLEVDATAAAPFLIFTIDPARYYRTGRGDPEALLAVLRAGLDPLADGLSRAAADGLVRVVAGLPASAQVLHAAVRPRPEGAVVRLVVRMPWRVLPTCVASLGWSGDPAAFEDSLARLCRRTLVHSVNVDLTPDLGPQVGIEFHHATAPDTDPRWVDVLDELEAVAACSPAKRRAIEAWCRMDRSVEVTDLAMRSRRGGVVRLQHDLMVKAIYTPGARLRAKAYLGVAPVLAIV